MTMSRKKLNAAETRALLAAIVESSDDAILSKDLNGTIMSWNRGAELVFGYTAAEMIGRSVLTLIPPDRHQEENYILGQIRDGHRIRNYETIRRCKDGTLINVSLTISPIFGEGRKIIGASKIARDITEAKKSAEMQHLLMREISHRSKNLLSIIQAVVHRTAATTPPEELARRISHRLQALGMHQDLLIEQNWRGVDVDTLVRSQLSHVSDMIGGRITVEGPPFVLDPAAGQALGMTLHELSSNAIKYGALSNGTGKVSVTWNILPNGSEKCFAMTWRESGGPPVTRPVRTGFGSTVIERLTSESFRGEARLAYQPDGVVWTLKAPAANIAGG